MNQPSDEDLMGLAHSPNGAGDPEYTNRLERLGSKWWKVALDTQRPYRWNLRRLDPGRTLDIGCGIGRNLVNLPPGSVGVDRNVNSINVVREHGLTAYSVDEFPESVDARLGYFDTILFSHVIEHVDPEASRSLVADYLPYLDANGKLIVICPQERGYASDATHVKLYDFDDLGSLVADVGFRVTRSFSFPFPRVFGKLFTYNEFVVVATRN